VHAAREDALCVMHLHTDYGIAVSAQKDGLLPISQQAMFPSASLAYHDYEGLALNEDEKPRLVSDLGDKKNMILRNHGLLTIGRLGLALNEDEKPRLVSDLGDKKNMILRNHGLLTIGRTAAEAFLSMYL